MKVDTGMHRVGVWPPEDALGFVRRASAAGFELEGLWTHFARSEEDAETTKLQLERFVTVVEAVRDAGHRASLPACGEQRRHDPSPRDQLDLVRPGIALYGIPPAPAWASDLGLRPALVVADRVTFDKRLAAGERLSYGHRYELERDAWVATVPVGYADGYPRSASSRAEVLIGGRRCRVAGNVTMDQIMVDCGELAVEAGDDVSLLGAQGDETITAWELAERAGTIALRDRDPASGSASRGSTSG